MPLIFIFHYCCSCRHNHWTHLPHRIASHRTLRTHRRTTTIPIYCHSTLRLDWADGELPLPLIAHWNNSLELIIAQFLFGSAHHPLMWSRFIGTAVREDEERCNKLSTIVPCIYHFLDPPVRPSRHRSFAQPDDVGVPCHPAERRMPSLDHKSLANGQLLGYIYSDFRSPLRVSPVSLPQSFRP